MWCYLRLLWNWTTSAASYLGAGRTRRAGRATQKWRGLLQWRRTAGERRETHICLTYLGLLAASAILPFAPRLNADACKTSRPLRWALHRVLSIMNHNLADPQRGL